MPGRQQSQARLAHNGPCPLRMLLDCPHLLTGSGHALVQIFYTDPTSNVTSLYNMILSNATMSYYAQVYTAEPGLSPDGKPSVVLDYGISEIVPVRVFRDELRQVGPEVMTVPLCLMGPLIMRSLLWRISLPVWQALEYKAAHLLLPHCWETIAIA